MKIYKMNDCDWVAAETIEDAKKCHANMMGLEPDAKYENEFCDGTPVELTDEKLDSLKFVEEDKTHKTFREKLKEMQDNGDKFPCFFASTEF